MCVFVTSGSDFLFLDLNLKSEEVMIFADGFVEEAKGCTLLLLLLLLLMELFLGALNTDDVEDDVLEAFVDVFFGALCVDVDDGEVEDMLKAFVDVFRGAHVVTVVDKDVFFDEGMEDV